MSQELDSILMIQLDAISLKDINYWDQEWTHLEEKTIIMINWLIKIKLKTKVRNWVENQIWISSETLWLCQDII